MDLSTLVVIERWVGWAGGMAALALFGAALTGAWRGLRQPGGRESGAANRILRAPFYVLVSVGFVGLCVVLWRPLPLSLSIPARLAALAIGLLLYAPGIALWFWGWRTLGEMFNVSSGFAVKLYAGHRLIAHGPFALVRHPMYLGVLMAAFGGVLIYRTWAAAFVALCFLGLLLRARREEKVLSAEFGEEWEAYCRRVPAWLPLRGGDRSAVALVALWIIAAAAMGAKLLLGAAGSDLGWLIGLASVAYIALLIWRLSHARPPAAALPDLQPIALGRLSFWGMIWTIIGALALCFVLGIAVHPWAVLTVASAAIAVWLMVVWRSRITGRLAALGVLAGLIAGLATWPLRQEDPLGIVFIFVSTPLLFIGGGLLLEHTGLARVRLVEGQYALGLASFLWACVLALPPALLNILGGMQLGDTWARQWWHPLAALAPGIAEETWARLFLTTLAYALLRPTTNDRPRRAVAAAVLIGTMTHALAHLPTLSILSPAGVSMIVGGLMYGVPMALLFIKRDWEHAVGYHFFVDFVRFLAALYRL